MILQWHSSLVVGTCRCITTSDIHRCSAPPLVFNPRWDDEPTVGVRRTRLMCYDDNHNEQEEIWLAGSQSVNWIQWIVYSCWTWKTAHCYESRERKSAGDISKTKHQKALGCPSWAPSAKQHLTEGIADETVSIAPVKNHVGAGCSQCLIESPTNRSFTIDQRCRLRG